MALCPAELTLGRYSQHISRCKGRESPMVECALCRKIVRKSYLPQHLHKEQENKGILNFVKSSVRSSRKKLGHNYAQRIKRRGRSSR